MEKLIGSNANVIKQRNRSLILNIIKQKDGISRAELSKVTGLSKGGITPIISELLKMGLVVESGVSLTDSGRRPITLALRSSGCYAIAVDWTRKNYIAAIVDFTGHIIAKEDYLFKENDTLKHILDRLTETIARFLHRSESSRMIGIGVVAPGPLDIRKGIILSPPNFWGWSNIPIRRILDEAFHLPVLVDNNANAYALAEKNYGKGKAYHNFVHMVIDEGIGAGIIIDDRIYRGKGKFGSEVGHISINMDGPVCACGNHGCVEVYATIPRIIEQLNNYTELGVPSSFLSGIRKQRKIEWEDILHGLQTEDAVCVNLMKKEAFYLGNALITIVNILEPEAIILGSRIAQAGKFILNPLREYVSVRTVTHKLQKAEIFLSDLPRASLIGGAMLIFQNFIDKSDFGLLDHTSRAD